VAAVREPQVLEVLAKVRVLEMAVMELHQVFLGLL
jgi:hypothetical protein